MYRRFSAALAIVAATVGASAFATSAQAVTLSDTALVAAAGPDASIVGNVAWDFTNGKITPSFSGTLGADDDRCFRVRMRSYDEDTLVQDKHGAKYCFKKEGHHEEPIELVGKADARTDRVDIAVEEQNLATDEWMPQADDDTALRMWDDLVVIDGDGIDIAGSGFDQATGRPTSGSWARVSWSLEDGRATAEYDGTEYLDDFFPGCGRVELRYLDEAGDLVDTVDGASNCPADKGFYPYHETLAAAPSPRITQVEVAMQSSGDHGVTWTDVETKTVSIAAQG